VLAYDGGPSPAIGNNGDFQDKKLRRITIRMRWKADIDHKPGTVKYPPMFRLILTSVLLCAACGAVEQPKSAKTVAAYEVPLPTVSDKRQFLALLMQQAKAAGFHVDAASEEDLKATTEVSPQTFNATVWRGQDDDEPIMSAMDFKDCIGRVWISFSLGEDPVRSRQFREALVAALKLGWPETAALPIMPSGAIPLTRDLVRTPQGYIVNPSAAAKYNAQSDRHRPQLLSIRDRQKLGDEPQKHALRAKPSHRHQI
jgi:hypothetical protein